MGNKTTAQAMAGLINDLKDNELLVLTASETRPFLKTFLQNPRAVLGSFSSVTLAPDLIPRDWTIVEDVTPSDFRVEDLEFISFLEGEESSVKVMRERAVTLKANLGLVDGKRILNQQDKLPVEIRGNYINLPGTLLRDSSLRGPSDRLHMAYLGWGGECWCLCFHWFGDGLDGRNRLARRKVVGL